ncbi:MAG: hypothetical protein KF838_04480 [Phycisphaeraceae bacterium]|nr:MAG: hypothetical protein KF838_04480 [Phycisphaeraceae bacterium]
MQPGMTVTKQVHFNTRSRGRRAMGVGPATPRPNIAEGSIPHVSRLMALAIKLDGLIRSGAVTDQAGLARVGHVSRARVTQIMNLLLLAPDIQEEILFLPATRKGRDRVTESALRRVSSHVQWADQRREWRTLGGHSDRPRGR